MNCLHSVDTVSKPQYLMMTKTAQTDSRCCCGFDMFSQVSSENPLHIQLSCSHRKQEGFIGPTWIFDNIFSKFLTQEVAWSRTKSGLDEEEFFRIAHAIPCSTRGVGVAIKGQLSTTARTCGVHSHPRGLNRRGRDSKGRIVFRTEAT